MAVSLYTCSDCGASFEIRATLQEHEEHNGPAFQCSSCHSKNIRRKFSFLHFIKNTLQDSGGSQGCCGNGSAGNTKQKCCPCSSGKRGNGCCK